MLPQTLYDRHEGECYPVDPSQIEAYEHLCANPRAGLFYEMGLSKTVVVLTYLYDLHYRDCAITKTLVVAPDKVARITWPDEIDKWAHLDGMRYSVVAGNADQRIAALSADAEIYIIGVDNLTWLIDQYITKKGGKLPFDCVALDELSVFKSRGSKRFKAIRRAIRTVEYRIGLTGTPGSLIDLWAQLCILDDGERLGRTFGQYVDKYFTIRGNGMIVYEYTPRAGAYNVIAGKIRDIVISKRWDKKQLPPCHTDDVTLELGAFDREIYDQLEHQYALDFFDNSEVTVKTAADLTNKLLQISSGAVYGDGRGNARPWHQVNTAKIDALRALLDEHPGENFVVVYQYRHEIDRIKAAFPFVRELRKGKHTREDVRDWNAGKIRLLLLHPASAGHGLNLQFGGRRLVWFTLTWNLEHYLQTVARLWRRGQEKEVFIHRLIVRGTRDVRVARRVASKDSNQTFLMNEIKDLRQRYYGKEKAPNRHSA